MNIHQLTPDEASYLLFAIKKALQDRTGITPGMEQFYESTGNALSQKLQRISGSGEDGIKPPKRHRYAEVRATWHPESLDALSRDLARDHGKARED